MNYFSNFVGSMSDMQSAVTQNLQYGVVALAQNAQNGVQVIRETAQAKLDTSPVVQGPFDLAGNFDRAYLLKILDKGKNKQQLTIDEKQHLFDYIKNGQFKSGWS